MSMLGARKMFKPTHVRSKVTEMDVMKGEIYPISTKETRGRGVHIVDVQGTPYYLMRDEFSYIGPPATINNPKVAGD